MSEVNPIEASLRPIPISHPQFKEQLILILRQLVTYTGAETNLINSVVTRETFAWLPEPEIDNSPTFVPEFNNSLYTVTALDDYTAGSNEFVNASNGVEIAFPQYPELDARLAIRNNDGSNISYSGNGKKIGKWTGGYLEAEEEVRYFQYFIDDDKWYQVMAYQPKDRQLSHQQSNLLELILEQLKQINEAKQ